VVERFAKRLIRCLLLPHIDVWVHSPFLIQDSSSVKGTFSVTFCLILTVSRLVQRGLLWFIFFNHFKSAVSRLVWEVTHVRSLKSLVLFSWFSLFQLRLLTSSFIMNRLLFLNHANPVNVFSSVHTFCADVIKIYLIALVGISLLEFKPVNHVYVILSQINFSAWMCLLDRRRSYLLLVEYKFSRASLGAD